MRIRIVDAFELGNCLAVRYEFDDGFTGQVNFNLDVTEEQIDRTLEWLYEQRKKAVADEPKRKDLIDKLKAKSIQ